MKKKSTEFILLLILLLFLPALGMAMDVTLAWDPSEEENLIGYRIYAREDGEVYNYNQPEWEGTDTECTIEGFDEYESYYFVVRAYDAEGNESGDSNEVYLPTAYETDDESDDVTDDESDASSLDNGDSGGAKGGGGGGGGCFIGAMIAD